MPAPDRSGVDEQRRGELFTAPTVIEQHESLDPARQPMRRETVARQGAGRRDPRAKDRRRESRIIPFQTNPASAADYLFFRVSNECWHIAELRQQLCAPLKKAH